MRQITKKEWDEYDWIEVTTVGEMLEGKAVFIRGVEYIDPPQDGYVYIDRTVLADSIQRWVPAVTNEEKDE